MREANNRDHFINLLRDRANVALAANGAVARASAAPTKKVSPLGMESIFCRKPISGTSTKRPERGGHSTFAVALGVAYQTALGKSLWSYVVGSRIELRKVVWPTRQESIQATLMIAVVVLLMALLLWGLDSLLLWGVETLTGRGA